MSETALAPENTLLGVHHATAITSDGQKIFDFFAKILGMHLIKKTVNQDDVETYHLYFTDDKGAPGTDMTFFDFPGIPKGIKGTNSISRVSFRVPNDASQAYWEKRFTEHNVAHEAISTQFGAKVLPFHDFDDQQYQLISDEDNHGVPGGTPWQKSPVPPEYAIQGLGPVRVTVYNQEHFDLLLRTVMGFKKVAEEGQFTLYEVNDGGHGGQIVLEHREDLPLAVEGYGNVHHAAWRVPDRGRLDYWIYRLKSFDLPQSGYIDRYYFKSEYFRAAPQILFEIATDGPGFLQDETYEEAGIHLELPPFLEPHRAEIEANLHPLNTEI